MRKRWCVVAVCAFAGLSGCDGEKVKPAEIKINEPDPVATFKSMLEQYVKGQPVTSEATTMDVLIGKIKLQDPAKGEIAEKGWAEILKNKGSPSAKAKDLLAKLK